MNNLNSILIEGNVVRSPSLRHTPKGTAVCLLSVAVNRWYPNPAGTFTQEVSFFDVELWGELANQGASSCEKGRGVRIVGRLKQDRWNTAEGKIQSKVKIIAEQFELKPRFSKSLSVQENGNFSDIAEGAQARYQELDSQPVF